MLLDRIKGNGMCKAPTLHMPVNGAEDHELLTVDSTAQRCTEQPFDLGLMCDEHFAPYTEPAGLTKKD